MMKIEYSDDLFTKEELKNTPKRHKKFIKEWVDDSLNFNFTTFESKIDEMIIIRGKFYSMCSHHLVPFFGDFYIGYIPNGKIAGLSKFSRTVNMFAHRPQVQEKLTDEIATYLDDKLKPKGLIIIMKARHLCIEIRGIKTEGETTTSSLRGIYKTDSDARKEFLDLMRR